MTTRLISSRASCCTLSSSSRSRDKSSLCCTPLWFWQPLTTRNLHFLQSTSNRERPFDLWQQHDTHFDQIGGQGVRATHKPEDSRSVPDHASKLPQRLSHERASFLGIDRVHPLHLEKQFTMTSQRVFADQSKINAVPYAIAVLNISLVRQSLFR